MAEEISGNTKRTRASIDRVEDGDWAVVLVGEDESFSIDLPVSMLPDGAQPGSHIEISVRLDEDSRRAAEDRIKSLQDRLESRSQSSAQRNFKL